MNLAGCETLNSRRMVIEHAHDGHPDAPVYDGADDFLGFRSSASGAIIDLRRLSFVAARQGARCKVVEETRKASEARAAYLRRGPREGGAGDATGSRGDRFPKKNQKAGQTGGAEK